MAHCPELAPKILFRTGSDLRAACRCREFHGQTSGQAPGYVQANLVILPQKYAVDFTRFCAENSAPCPLLEVTQPGCYEAERLAPGSDLRTDLPLYRIWREGQLCEERADITDLCDESMQAFLLGCSFTWEDLLATAGHLPRHIEEGKNVPMYDTSIKLKEVGPFSGSMVVSMRPYRPEVVPAVSEITASFLAAHGPPVQVGEPSAIGVSNCDKPEYGEAVGIKADEIPVFWACGVTPAKALQSARLPFAITHAPGHMFVADIKNDELKSWPIPGSWRGRPTE